MGKTKIFLVGLLVVFLSAGCDFFSKSLPGGIVKTVNGGADWQFSNAVKGNAAQSLTSLNIAKIAFAPIAEKSCMPEVIMVGCINRRTRERAGVKF